MPIRGGAGVSKLEDIIEGWYNAGDYDTLADCLTEAGSNAVIIIPPTTYSEAITISGSNLILRGSGWNTKIVGGTTGHAINITGDSVTIEDLLVQTTAGQGNAYDGIYLNGADDCVLRRIRLDQSDNEAIQGVSSDRLTIEQCFLELTDSHMIHPNNGCTEWLLLNNYLKDAGNYTLLGQGNNGRVIGNHTLNGGNCFYVNAPYWVLLGNFINNPSANGIGIDSGGDNSTMVGNFIYSAGERGIYITTNAEDCVAVGNRITGSGIANLTDNSGTSTVGYNDLT